MYQVQNENDMRNAAQILTEAGYEHTESEVEFARIGDTDILLVYVDNENSPSIDGYNRYIVTRFYREEGDFSFRPLGEDLRFNEAYKMVNDLAR